MAPLAPPLDPLLEPHDVALPDGIVGLSDTKRYQMCVGFTSRVQIWIYCKSKFKKMFRAH